MSNEVIKRIDTNNEKALGIVSLTLTALENGLDGIDPINSLEVIRDYLKTNSTIFDQNM